MCIDDNTYHELTDEETEAISSIINDLPKEFVSILNVQNYNKMLSSIAKIKTFVDRYMSGYDEAAEYSIRFADTHSVLLEDDVCFCVKIPKDIGIYFDVATASGITSCMSKDDIISINPCSDGRIDILFDFKHIKTILSAK